MKRKVLSTDSTSRHICAGFVSLFLFSFSTTSFAGQSELEEMIVTGVREQRLAKIPRNVSVVTADDIARSSSNDVATLLAREANLELRSVTGNDKFSGIDIRGMGDTFSSNVIVLVDGARLNAPDLSGADFSSIALGQIERIEVLRGGGGVRYGNGAVGGVINIITKKADAERANINAELSYGSFNTQELRLGLNTARGGWGLALDAVSSDSDGYRHNSALRKDDVSANLRYTPVDWLSLELSARYHKDRYGLPGSVSREAFTTSSLSRRQASFPDDEGETTDRRYRARTIVDFSAFGTLTALADYRSRDNPFVIGFSPLLSVQAQQSKIRENSSTLELTHALTRSLGEFQFSLNSGFSHYRSRYAQRRNGRNLTGQSQFFPGSIDNHSAFVDFGIQYAEHIYVNAGYRRDVFDLKRRAETLREFCDFETVTVLVPQVIPFVGTIFRSVDSIVETNCRDEFEVTSRSKPRWKNHAYDFGIVLTPIRNLNIFASHSRSFRNPNIDELTLSSSDLGPQAGEHFDIGFRYRLQDSLELSLALFRMEIEDEIFFGFDPVLSQNRNTNLDGVTRRRGGELEISVSPLPRVRIWGAYGFIKATNQQTGAAVPLVAEDTFTLGGRFETPGNLSVEAVARYTGPRFDGNDFDNQSFRKLDPHTVVDAKISYRYKKYRVALGINNLFNEIYSTSVYSGTYFPMPERNLFASIGVTL